MVIAPGSPWTLADYYLKLKRTLGFSAIHQTGSEVDYRPHWPALGYVIGAYGVSEESNTVHDPKLLSKELSWMLYDAVASHIYVSDAMFYLDIEDKTHWFSQNKRLLQILGKANWIKPDIAVFMSAKNRVLFPYGGAPLTDVGRGTLPAAHYRNVYVTESEIKAGLAQDYPIMMDANNSCLDADTIDYIGRYVAGGGTFIALESTGRHGYIDADSWPIARLTGLKVLGYRTNQTTRVPADSRLLPDLAGQSFPGSGIALGWVGADGRAAEPDPYQVIARWDDGTMAMGIRQVGKGRIVVLGSNGWTSRTMIHNTSMQTVFLRNLFAGLGVHQQVDCDDESIWLQRQTTKNGLQDLIVMFNTAKQQRTLSMAFPKNLRPEIVADMVTGERINFSYDGNMMHIADVQLPGESLRIITMRAGSFPEALRTWFGDKAKYWSQPATPQSNEHSQGPTPEYNSVIFDRFRFRMGDAASATQQTWQNEDTGSPAWKDVGYGFWDDMGYPKTGTGLYRTSFDIPPQWSSKRILLRTASFNWPVFLEHAAIYLNGTRLMDYTAPLNVANTDSVDVTKLLRNGRNDLAILVNSRECRGGFLGQIGMYTLQDIRDPVELTDWRVHRSVNDSTAVHAPLDVSGAYVATDVMIPATWANSPIFLEFESPASGPCMALINEQPITFMDGISVQGIFQVNISALVHPGAVNHLELWPNESIIWGRKPSPRPASIVLRNLRVGHGN